MYLTTTPARQRAHMHGTRNLACGHVQFVDLTVVADARPCEHCTAPSASPSASPRAARPASERTSHARRQPCPV